MAKHVWETKQFSPATVEQARQCLLVAVARVVTDGCVSNTQLADAVTFVGYQTETVRQSGGRSANSPARLLARAARRGSVYATGHNKDNYYRAGHRLLCQAYGVADQTPDLMLYDVIRDREGWL